MRMEDALTADRGTVCQPRDFHWARTAIPCQHACPAHTDIPGYLAAVARGDFDRAYWINLRDNVFPGVLGRVCTRPCEPVCRHGRLGLGEPVAICASKRVAADARRNGPVILPPLFPPSGKRIAVIGAGPAGLAIARDLARLGHGVVVYERHTHPGGLMVQGIPEFRLPRSVVTQEIQQVLLCGVELRCGVDVGRDIRIEDVQRDQDAVILATGADRLRFPNIEGASLHGVMHGVSFLRTVNGGGSVRPGPRTLIIGGGFTAMDCARMARRLGAQDVTIFYRRTRADTYISASELGELDAEGIRLQELTSPTAFLGLERVESARLIRMQILGAPGTGVRRVEPVRGSEYLVMADTVLLCTGQEPGPLAPERTPQGNLWQAGDCHLGSTSLIETIGHARRVARDVDRVLMGVRRIGDVIRIESAVSTGRSRELDQIPRQTPPELPVQDRVATSEVEMALPETQATTEASRCYLCNFKFEIDNNVCIYCDHCLRVRPVPDCIVKVSDLKFRPDGSLASLVKATGANDYELLCIDQDACIRCGACVSVCPVNCIHLTRCSLEPHTTEHAEADYWASTNPPYALGRQAKDKE